MSTGANFLSSGSVYSQLCWNCITKSRAAAATGSRLDGTLSRSRANRGSSASSRAPVRRLHVDRRRQAQQLDVPTSSSATTSPPPEIVLEPIRKRLAKWQKEHGDPRTELLGIDTPFGVRHVAADTVGARENKDELDPDNDVEAGELPPSELEADLSPYGPNLLQMGDLVELQSSRAHVAPTLAVFLRRVLGSQIQLVTIRGKWVAVDERDVAFTIPRFIDAKLVEPILPHVPVGGMLEELLGQTHIFDIGVPRTVTAPVVVALNRFSQKAEEVYRKHAASLDNAHDLLAHATDLRFGTLDRIADRLIGKQGGANRMAELYAVRRALLEAGMCFGVDKRSHKVTGVFQIRSKEQVQYVSTAIEWLRQFQEVDIARRVEGEEAAAALMKKSNFQGARVVQGFVEKAKQVIKESRRHRSAAYANSGTIGPSDVRRPIDSPQTAVRFIPTTNFTANEKVLIRVLEFAGVQNMLVQEGSLSALLPSLLRATGLYGPDILGPSTDAEILYLGKRAVYAFLLEIGVFAPFEDLTYYDVNLLLPGSQHSRPLQQLASALDQLDKDTANLQDGMKDIRKNLKGTTAYAIDDAGAQELDDAISIERIPGNNSQIWIHSHIANPTAYISRDSMIARMAAHLTETYYAPDRTVPLLPKWLSRDLLSVGPKKPCITFSALVDDNGTLLDVKIQHGKLDNVVRLTYGQLAQVLGTAPSTINSEPMVVGGTLPKVKPVPLTQPSSSAELDLKLLHKFTMARHRYRISQRVLDYQFRQPPIQVLAAAGQYGLPAMYPRRDKGCRTEGDPLIAIYPNPCENPFMQLKEGTDTLVSEAMLLAGEVCALWCDQRNIPVPFRSTINKTGEPTYREAWDTIVQPSLDKHGYVTVNAGERFAVGRGIQRTTSILFPHFNLGLRGYVKTTSPLRRYGDMITHWQLDAALQEEARTGRKAVVTSSNNDFIPFSRAQMDNITIRLQPRENLISRSKQRSLRHWLSHFFFRAHHFNEYPLPELYTVRVLRQANSFVSSTGRGNLLCLWMETGIVLKLNPLLADGSSLEYGDIVEARIYQISPYYPDTVLEPLRLISREEQ